MFRSFGFVIAMCLSLVANAYVVDFGVEDPNNFGGTWDNPNATIDKVLQGLEDELGDGLTLSLVAQDVWSGVGATSVILEEIAGYRFNTRFGWYNSNDPLQSQMIFNGADDKNSAPVSVDFGSFLNIGFYIDPNGVELNRIECIPKRI